MLEKVLGATADVSGQNRRNFYHQGTINRTLDKRKLSSEAKWWNVQTLDNDLYIYSYMYIIYVCKCMVQVCDIKETLVYESCMIVL